MKETLSAAFEWISEKVKKYGWQIAILVIVIYGIKKIWFWVAMPILFLVFLKQIALLGGYDWVEKIRINYLISSWVFVFTCLKIIGETLFEDKN